MKKFWLFLDGMLLVYFSVAAILIITTDHRLGRGDQFFACLFAVLFFANEALEYFK